MPLLRGATQAQDCVNNDLDIYHVHRAVAIQIVGRRQRTEGLVDQALHVGHVVESFLVNVESSITAMCSSAGRAVGAPRWRLLPRATCSERGDWRRVGKGYGNDGFMESVENHNQVFHFPTRAARRQLRFTLSRTQTPSKEIGRFAASSHFLRSRWNGNANSNQKNLLPRRSPTRYNKGQYRRNWALSKRAAVDFWDGDPVARNGRAFPTRRVESPPRRGRPPQAHRRR